VERLKHKATSLESRLKDVVEAKKTTEKFVKDMTAEKDALELKRDTLKEKAAKLEEDLVAARAEVKESKGVLAEYFDDDFEHARAQALHFDPDAYLSGLDPFKILVMLSLSLFFVCVTKAGDFFVNCLAHLF